MAVLALILVTILLPSLIQSSVLLTREDCTDLYSMVRGQRSDNVIDIFRRISSQGLNLDDIVRLYNYCLRSEDGIRYRRMDPSIPIHSEHHQHLGQQEPTVEISWNNNKLDSSNNKRDFKNPENPEL